MKLSKAKGCILGVAIGDALGAPVEFDSIESIKSKYGKGGVTNLARWGGFPAGSYTDDTQMSMATARGIIQAGGSEEINIIRAVYAEYLSWLKTQTIPHERRAPGNTCLGALGSGKMGRIEKPINNSKGCGGVMRTAPVGLVFSGAEAFRVGAACAALTHGHPSGYLSAGFLSELVSHLVDDKPVREGIDFCLKILEVHEEREELLAVVSLALEPTKEDLNPEQAIPTIGEGWTGEEALGIALYCALRFEHDFRAGVLAAVNHGGDSDSTGSITGAILGARLGIEAIPKDWVERVENSQEILQIAKELFRLREKITRGAAM